MPYAALMELAGYVVPESGGVLAANTFDHALSSCRPSTTTSAEQSRPTSHCCGSSEKSSPGRQRRTTDEEMRGSRE